MIFSSLINDFNVRFIATPKNNRVILSRDLAYMEMCLKNQGSEKDM